MSASSADFEFLNLKNYATDYLILSFANLFVFAAYEYPSAYIKTEVYLKFHHHHSMHML